MVADRPLDLDALPVGPTDHDVRVYREDTLTGPGIEAVIAKPKAATTTSSRASPDSGRSSRRRAKPKR